MISKPVKQLLLIEDNAGDARLLREMLREHQAYSAGLTHVTSMDAAEAHLAKSGTDIILLDLGLPDAQGVTAVLRAHAAAPRVPLVVLTGLDDEILADRALQEGAQDYLVKGEIGARALLRAIRYAIERKNMEEALLEEKERAQVTLDCIGDAVACTDAAGNITFVNRVAESLTGWSSREAMGRPVGEVIRVIDANNRETVPIPIWQSLKRDRKAHLRANCLLVRRDGTEIPIEDSVAPIHDRSGRAIGAVIVFRDVSIARTMALQMMHSAQHDFLTGLPNRMLLNDRVSHAISIAPRHDKKVAVLYLDLDGFKHVNDSLGHPVGDKLLKSVAGRLVDCVRGSDTVSRQGGDEFVVLLSEIQDAEDAAITARRMLDAVAEPHSIDQHELNITTSIGVSIFPDDGLDSESLIKNADMAMYQAKQVGRQSYKFFKPAMNVRAVERQSIEESLRGAVERNELSLHYQPKINLETGSIIGAEALLRWTHPTRGAISPATFIPVAEDCGLILSIGAWVLRNACEQARAWVDAGLPTIVMAVNISAVEFRERRFAEGLFETVVDSGLDPSSLQLELTESVLMQHAESAGSVLTALRDKGVQVAVDDFGTGYSSLSHLRKCPVDVLKIDQSFIRQITAAGDDTAIVTAVIGMARNLKLQVIAEGVETLEQLAFLHQHQCDEGQGFYFSRPVLAQEFANLLAAGGLSTGASLRRSVRGLERQFAGTTVRKATG